MISRSDTILPYFRPYGNLCDVRYNIRHSPWSQELGTLKTIYHITTDLRSNPDLTTYQLILLREERSYVTTEAYTEHSLTDAQREQCLEGIDQDTYVTLPITLPTSTIECANAYIDTHCAQIPAAVAAERGFSETNIVERDPVFRELFTYKTAPATELRYIWPDVSFRPGQVDSQMSRGRWPRSPSADMAFRWSTRFPRSRRSLPAAHPAFGVFYERRVRGRLRHPGSHLRLSP